MATQDFSREALATFGLETLARALPEVRPSTAAVGTVTTEAARATGLLAGTPVACGLHDVTASAFGIGAHAPGTLGIVAGTYSINEIVSDEPRVDARWFCRNAIEPGRWNNMAISPASTANYDWFVDTLCRAERDAAEAVGRSIHERLAPEIEAAFARPSTALFHPYLFGSPFGGASSGGFVGLHGWHGRGELLRAVLEGIAFNHRTHVDALRERFEVRDVRLTGGVSRNPRVARLFADVLGLAVTVSAVDEAAAFGAAACAGIAVGAFESIAALPDPGAGAARVHEPDLARVAEADERFALYERVGAALAPHWPTLEDLGETRR